MVKGLYILGSDSFQKIYGEEERANIEEMVEIIAPPQTTQSIYQNLELLKDVEIILSGWGCPRMDRKFLAAAPKLRAVFYGAGSIRNVVTEAFWQRGIRITSAYAANAIPVAEFTVSQLIFCLKRAWQYALEIKRNKKYPARIEVTGAYGSTVGLISLGMIARQVCELLRNYDLKILAYDPFVSKEEAKRLNVELCSLEDIFRFSDVVSLHSPWLKETENMIRGNHFEVMKENASFINTARGAIVNEKEMIAVLQKRPDLLAVLDVTWPEPPLPDSPLYDLDNVVLMPHIAGSLNGECRRMGRYIVEELERYLNGKPLMWEITEEKLRLLA
ncbi:MAG: hydroxyacid dehydrogenase [Firmicutes bacterium]|nr:hydroxyacid dehydrogenase [Bacillota bacterium]